MEKKSAQDLRTSAAVSYDPPPPLDRKARLARWADLLDRDPGRRINLIRELEFASRSAQVEMRADESALSTAYADPLFRSMGLSSDRVGDGQAFFGLSESQTHRLLCSCMHGMSMRAGDAARLIRSVANPLPRALTRGVLAAAVCATPIALYLLG